MFEPRDAADVHLTSGLPPRTRHAKPRDRAAYVVATPRFQYAISRVLQRMRFVANLSERELGSKIGIDRAVVVRNESATQVPRIELCWAWAAACGFTLEQFAREVEALVSRPSAAQGGDSGT